MTQREALKMAIEALEQVKSQIHEELYYNELLGICEKAITTAKEALAQPERHELQAEGKHPAPCARFCEANAFQIEIRNLKAMAQKEYERGLIDGKASK